MKKILSFIFAIIGWFAVIAQYFLMLNNKMVSPVETTVRFFSFFTILTNTLVAIYFTFQFLKKEQTKAQNTNAGILTALTVYIVIVGLVYQILLRQLWTPTGLQKIVDEILHSFTPIAVIIFWYMYEDKKSLKYSAIFKWLIYPIFYLIYILIRGNFSNFYPYPFVDVTNLGLIKVLTNAVLLTLLFISVSVLFIFAGKLISK